MSGEPSERLSRLGEVTSPVANVDPLGLLARLTAHQARLESRLLRAMPGQGLPRAFSWLEEWVGTDVLSERVEVRWRPSGLRRPGLVAQLSWPLLSTRLALGIETPIAHAIVDRLLGFERLAPESRLQLTPVEWGILTFVVARSLEGLGAVPGPLGPWDLALDRVGPDPFDPTGLGEVVTLRWTARIGSATGSVRLWLPETLVARWLTSDTLLPPAIGAADLLRYADLTGVWRAEAGTVSLPRGPGTLRAGGILPLIDSRLSGTPRNLGGPVELALVADDRYGRYAFPSEPTPLSGGGRLTIAGPLSHQQTPRKAIAVNPPQSPSANSPADLPVTLIIELGRVNLPLHRLADLRAGDVIELGRHSREPVELTSGGRLVARGELVQIDTELGVRVTQLFL